MIFCDELLIDLCYVSVVGLKCFSMRIVVEGSCKERLDYVCEECMMEKECNEGIKDMNRNINVSWEKLWSNQGERYAERWLLNPFVCLLCVIF